MSNDLNRRLRKEIPDEEAFKLGTEEQKGFQVQRGNRNHFKQNKLHEQKGHMHWEKKIFWLVKGSSKK